MRRWLDRLQPWGALLMRLVLGVAMIYHGHSKVIPEHARFEHPLVALQHYSRFVGSLGLPSWLAYVSAFTELLGGVFLLVGFLVRFAALMVAGNMLVALFAVNLHHGYEGSEYTLALISIAVMLLVYGAGALSIDRRIGLT